MEALNGILLPSTLAFLVLLANDKALLGPWANSTAQNWVSGVIVWAVASFSLAPLVTTFYPGVTLRECGYAFGACTVIGLAVAAMLWRPPKLSRAGRELLRERRAAWRAPGLETLRRSAPRAGSGCSCSAAYIVFAVVIMALKLV